MSANIWDQPLIQVKNLQKSFGANIVLDGVTVDIYKGDVVCVIGASGSGKSTFLRCLNLLEEPTGGQILFEGTDITDKKQILINTVRRWAWYFSNLIYFLI